MQDIVDIHCHFINFNSVPDVYIDHLLRKGSRLFDECFDEADFRDPDFKVRMIQWASDLLDNVYLTELINAFDDDRFWQRGGVVETLVQKNEYLVPENDKPEYRENRKGRIILFTPLMMDFIKASGIGRPSATDGVIPFAEQVKNHSRAALHYPWQVMPFFHFHPGRRDVVDLLKDAIENKGFIGVKLYPAMGFYPQPEKNTSRQVQNNLRHLYEYISSRECGTLLPMTVHTQYNSTQAIALKDLDDVMAFTDPENWRSVLKVYDLKINFAHYGGTGFTRSITLSGRKQRKKEFSTHCREIIQGYMDTYNREGKKRIFADTGAHSRRRRIYFECLNEDLSMPSRLIMFGTDIPAITPRSLMRDYMNDFLDNIQSEYRNRFFKQNALDFLFEEGMVPPTYIDFLRGSGNGSDPLDLSDVSYIQKQEDTFTVIS